MLFLNHAEHLSAKSQIDKRGTPFRFSTTGDFVSHECSWLTLAVSNTTLLQCERILIDLGASWNDSLPNRMFDVLCLSKFTRKATHLDSVSKTWPCRTQKISRLDQWKFTEIKVCLVSLSMQFHLLLLTK